MNTTRIGDLGIGALYLLRSEFNERHWRTEALHVMSPHAGGEVRGYRREAGSGDAWRVRLPAYEGHWPEVDQAAADLTGDAVTGLDGTTYYPRRETQMALFTEARQ